VSALNSFAEGVSEVRILLALSEPSEPTSVSPSDNFEADATATSLPDTSTSTSSGANALGDVHAEQDNAVRRAAVVLLVSHFESYLKSTAEEFIDTLSTGQLEAKRIPLGIRELHTMPRIDQIASAGDAIQRHALLKKLSDVSQLWNDVAKPAKGTLNARLFGKQVTSARPEKIDNIFALMGSSHPVCDGHIDIADTFGEITTTNIRLSLEDVVKCRNDIAHGDSSRKPTASDVSRYLDFLTALAARLERQAQGLASAYAT
jgi:hypothetical protein